MDLIILDASYSIFTIGVLIPQARVSSLVIKVFTGVKAFVPIFMIISAFIKGDLHNWQLTEEDYRSNTSESSDIYKTGGYSWPSKCTWVEVRAVGRAGNIMGTKRAGLVDQIMGILEPRTCGLEGGSRRGG